MLYHGTSPFLSFGVDGGFGGDHDRTRYRSSLYVLSRLRGNGRVKLSSHLKVNTNVMATLVKLSSSGMFQVFIGMASWIGLMRFFQATAARRSRGYTIGIRIILFALFPSL